MRTKDRMYRAFEVRAAPDDMIVEGYALTFDQPTVMAEIEGRKYSEVISRGAFDNAEMRDVVLNFDHQGKPLARTKNGTLALTVDDVGLHIRADLSSTAESRALYEEIKAGLIDKMSAAFIVGKENYDRETRTRKIDGFKRLYDVAAVTFPAYESTSIEARGLFDAEASAERAEASRALELAKSKYNYFYGG
jgi:HK97 family phage prohead protease